jgi:hypothetical protein
MWALCRVIANQGHRIHKDSNKANGTDNLQYPRKDPPSLSGRETHAVILLSEPVFLKAGCDMLPKYMNPMDSDPLLQLYDSGKDL